MKITDIVGNIISKVNATTTHKNTTGNPHGTVFSDIGSKPTTVSGYGLTDVYTKTEVNNSLALKVNNSEKGVANGVSTLDSNGKVLLTQIPDSVLGQLEYMGIWNFATLPTATQKGQYWIASVSGNGYIVGDWAVWNGTAFDKVDNTDAIATVAGRTGNVVLTKSDVGLGLVDNTSDASKPVSTAQATAIGLKADSSTVSSHTSNTSNPHSVTKTQVGLGNVDNTSDVNKPVSTAQATALNLKANLASPVFTGTVSGITKAMVGLSSVDNTADSAKNVLSATKLTTASTIGGVSFDGTANINLPGVNVAGNQNTTGNSATATNASNLGGNAPSYYQQALGFTPIQQGGGASQGTNKIHIGWQGPYLRCQVDGSDFGTTFPMNINGNAATATTVQGLDLKYLVPSGGIIMWSGSTASMPSGWVLCNGANGTPNLQDRFIVGAGSSYAVGATGGSADAVVVSHSHTASTNSTGAHTHTAMGAISGGATGSSTGIKRGTVTTSSEGDHSHAVYISSTGVSGTGANIPPYYALAFIMKT